MEGHRARGLEEAGSSFIIMSGKCQICRQFDSVCFCVCSDLLLCVNCSPTHSSHFLLPLDVFGQHKTPGYQERVQARFSAISAAQAAYQRNLQEFTACQSSLIDEVNKLIQQLYSFWTKQSEDLTALRLSLENDWNLSLSEAQNTVYDDNPTLTTKFAQVIRDFEDTELRFFTYAYDTQTAEKVLKQFCTYSISTPSSGGLRLPGVQGTALQVYNLKKGVKISEQLPVSFSDGTGYAVTGQGLIAVGGRPATASSWLYRENRVEELGRMHTSRGFPGLHLTSDFAYVFGGYDHSKGHPDCFLKSSEKLNLRSKLW